MQAQAHIKPNANKYTNSVLINKFLKIALILVLQCLEVLGDLMVV